MANENGRQRRMGYLRLLTNSLHDVVAYNPGEMMVLKGRGVEPRNARGPRREAQCEAKGLLRLSMAPLHHFHHAGKSSSSNLPCRSEAFAPPIAALRRFLDHHAASVDCRTIKPLCGCCSRGLSGQQTVRTKIFGCPKWLHMAAHAAQLAAVVLDMGKSPTSDVPTTNVANYSPIEATLHPNRAVFLCVLM